MILSSVHLRLERKWLDPVLTCVGDDGVDAPHALRHVRRARGQGGARLEASSSQSLQHRRQGWPPRRDVVSMIAKAMMSAALGAMKVRRKDR